MPESVPGSETQISKDEVSAAFQKLISSSEITDKFRICFFIDGLDEFQELGESYWRLADKLQEWCNNSKGAVKLCVSSREYPEIEDQFIESNGCASTKSTRPTSSYWQAADCEPYLTS